MSTTFSTATEAAQAQNAIETWDAPAFSAAKAVLGYRYPSVSKFLFYDLEAATGLASIAGVEQFLERVTMLRQGRALGFSAEDGRGAVELLGARKILDDAQESELRRLIAVAKNGSRPSEQKAREGVLRQREQQALEFMSWLHEWREVARGPSSAATTWSRSASSSARSAPRAPRRSSRLRPPSRRTTGNSGLLRYGRFFRSSARSVRFAFGRGSLGSMLSAL